MRSIKACCICVLALPAAYAASQTGWVAYSAEYTETSTTSFSSGKHTSSTKNGREVRSSDGSQAKYEVINGQVVSGELWLACGQAFSLDYSTKQATGKPRNPPQHAHVPPDPPLGTAVIAGVNATGYPIHMNHGTGAVWVGTSDEIPLKIEVHTEHDGVKTDLVRVLTSVDMNAADVDSQMKIPEGFTVSTSSAPGSCMAK